MITTCNRSVYNVNWLSWRAYMLAAIFIAGNIILPQLTHLIPAGGRIWLPIYFFTLIGAYKYGFTVGLTTALLSPLVNCILFGMPSAAMVMPIAAKSVILATAAAAMARYQKKVSFPGILATVVLATLGAGCLDMLLSGFSQAVDNLVVAWPGLLLQISGGYLVLKFLLK